MWKHKTALGDSVVCFILLVALCDAHRFCLGSHRVGINNYNSGDSNVPSNLRTCVKEISDQCLPFPCYKEGSERCIDGQASFTCQCRPGWKGPRCEDDIDECSDPDHQAGCNQKCYNSPGSFRCMCDDGYRFRTNEKIHCTDVDECEVGVCEGVCVNTMGSYSCRCEGRQGLRLAEDRRSCEEVPVCVQLYDYKHAEMLYLGEQFTGGPVIYLRFRLPENTKFAAEFDFCTFDPEGVVLYAESSRDSWFMLGLRGGRIEVQFKNQHSLKVTSGGKAINDGQWHVISVDELESSISVKISKEAVMSINSPGSLFTSVNGKLETKVYIAGLPNRTDSVIKPINPRLDGCIRGWNLMNQGSSGVKEVIQEKKSKHCFLHVERGTYFTGAGLAHFNVDYRESGSWRVDLKVNIRPSSSTGVRFALVLNDTVPLSVSVVTQGPEEAVSSATISTHTHTHTPFTSPPSFLQDLRVFLDGVSVATLQSLMLCYPDRLSVELTVNPTSLEIVANTSTWSYSLPDGALDRLNHTMTHSVRTCIGGLPDDIPVSSSPVTA
ncbi:vitamin K-dependent protein S-like isoform X4 [Salmo salar]|uniref:Vitamin K-dependent protein S-like isoform X4 n=1 Tax=Salmo salar TaxID=8030 RepID=A0ABM3EG10_SALSA|nr:vitamin K-dependent protein S-like isoform X4 [Salmo salar]